MDQNFISRGKNLKKGVGYGVVLGEEIDGATQHKILPAPTKILPLLLPQKVPDK